MKTKAILVMMFVVAGFVVPGWAEFRTVGEYDPSDTYNMVAVPPTWGNDVDLSAHYVSGGDPCCVITLDQFRSGRTGAGAGTTDFDGIATAYGNNMGGVVDAEIVNTFEGAAENIVRARYGTGGTKTLDIINTNNNVYVTDGSSGADEVPISGNNRFAPGSAGGFPFAMGDIASTLEGERVIVFCMTILQESDRGGTAGARATFSDGTWVESRGSISESGGPSTSDCFFGFVAPEGEYITSFSMGSFGGYAGWRDADDIGFITAGGESAGFRPSSDAGDDQSLQLYDADSATGSGVTLDGSVALPAGGESYTYAWSGGFDGGTATGATPTVYFSAAGTYVLTLTASGDGDPHGVLASDTVTITVLEPASNAGEDQTVQLHIANSTGVTLAGSVDDPYDGDAGTESYTYGWTSDPNWTTIDENGTTGADDAVVTFTATGDYILTLVATGDVQGALAPDNVRIRVVIPAIDAGGDVQVGKTIAAYPGIILNSKLSNPIDGETYTYAWSSVPSAGVTFTDADDADPAVTFPEAVASYTLTLDVTSTGGFPALQDTITVNVTEDPVMVAHFTFDDPNDYSDSSTEGDPNNHFFITDTKGGSGSHDGVVACGDSDAIANSNDDPLEVHLDHDPNGFNDAMPHLDNVDTAITVAFWIMNDYGRKVWAIEKVGTFAFGIDERGDLRTQLWFDAGDPNMVKSREGDGLGNTLEDKDLKINADGDSGGHEHVWHHIAFTYDSFTGYVEQFLDGALIREKYIGSGRLLDDDETTLAIGKNLTDFGDSVVGLRGAMDDIRIYNYALDYPEIAGLASMGEAATLVSAGDDVTLLDPNELPYQLNGKYIRLGQINRPDEKAISPGNDPGEFYVMWEQVTDPCSPGGTATFSDPGDPESDVSFSEPGTYTLRLVSFERLCGSDNEIRSEMTITIGSATDCAGYLAFGGDAGEGNVAGDDCIVSLEDLAALMRDYMLSLP